MKRIHLAIGAILILTAGAILYFWPEAEQLMVHDDVITLYRSGCYGNCPVYNIAIYGNGTVVYDGTIDVAAVGRRTSKISTEKFQQLVAEFEKANYFSLEDEYSFILDDPTITTSITIGGRRKTIVDYGQGPTELKNLAERIDEVAGTRQWVGD